MTNHTQRIMKGLAYISKLYEGKIWLPSITELTQGHLYTRPQVAHELLESPQLSLEVIFRCYAFARGGGADKAGYHRISVSALRRKMGNSSFEEFIKDAAAPTRLWGEFEAECVQRHIGINKKMNEELVKGLLRLSQNAPSYNIAVYIRDGISANIEATFARMNEIKGIGPKIASFMLRDFTWLFSLEEKIPHAHRHYLQPVDIWVGRTAQCLWPELKGEGYWPIAKRLAQECSRSGVSGIEFNQGAWYFGAQEVRNPDSLCRELSKL